MRTRFATTSCENARSQGVGFKTVVLVPLANKPPAWYKTASTDYHGAFSMSNIAPGEYRVFAWGLVPDNAWFDPEFLKPFEDKGPRISVAADARVTGLRVPLIVP